MSEQGNVFQDRLRKLESWREMGINPYGNGYEVKHLTSDVEREHGEKSREELEGCEESYQLAGRVMAKRMFGKAGFLRLQDRAGMLQVFVQKDAFGDVFPQVKMLDVGDIVRVEGIPFRTKTDELSLKVSALNLITKNLRPLPEKFHGLTDVETRYRQRYTDLIVNPEAKDVFLMRNRIIRYIRDFMDKHEFVEVETPMMHPLVSGAAAKPFKTHHNSLDMDLYLRIAPELYLKRLVVGGIERVYEINRNFRNEGISTRHNPEFTMMEFYWAYHTFEDLMDFSEEMISSMTEELLGKTVIPYGEREVNMGRPWKRMTMKEAVVHYAGLSAEDVEKHDVLLAKAKELKIEKCDTMPYGKLLTEVFEATAEEQLWDPTFITHYPVEVSPLARRNEDDPSVTDRFEFFVCGRELGNAFSELNDPIDQRQRFEAQVAAKQAGDDEACDMDDDYIRALEIGMPPAAGEGLGIDRLVMLLTNSQNIRDVILFPQLRKEQP